MADILAKIASELYEGEDQSVAELVQKALDQGMEPKEVLQGGLIAGMDEVGRDFKAGELFVPEVLIAARAMHAGMNVLRPLLSETDSVSAGKYLIGTVKGDGFETIDLGTDVEPQAFVDAVREHKPQMIGMSALLTTTMVQMRATVEALEEAGLRGSVKIMIGGAPVTEAFATQIGADAYAPDAASAVDKARELVA
jgi:5-methyltetrahydrofolate--homocysteine methyltransferase